MLQKDGIFVNKILLKIVALVVAACMLLPLAACGGTGITTTTTTVNGGGNGTCTSHVDGNDDGSCDVCRESVIIVIDFYAINDLHGQLFDSEDQPGVDELTGYLAESRAKDDYSVVLSSGDMWQGSSESNLTRGEMMTEWMNHIGVTSMTLGNHEFDWDEQYLYSNLAVADFPFLAINIYDVDTDKRVDYAQPSTIVECGDAKIGIIGAVGDCYSSISPDKVEGVKFKVGSELTALVKAESERLRNEGCDYIVYSIHDGLAKSGNGLVMNNDLAAIYDIVLSNGYVDLVFEAHSHYNYVLRDTSGVYHVQSGGYNSAIAHVEIELNYVTDTSRVSTAETVKSYIYGKSEPDGIVDKLKEKYKDTIAAGDELLGIADGYVSGDRLQQIVADTYIKFGVERWGDDYDIVLGGGYIGIRSPKHLESGSVYYRDIYSLFPFDNNMCLCSVSGRKLLDKFINTNNSTYYISYSDYGKGLKIDPNETYYIIVDTYSALYAPNGLTIIDKCEEDIFARDLLAQYIRDGGAPFR